MGVLTIHLECEYKNNAIRIISCEQICGHHIRVSDNPDRFKERLIELAEKFPDNYHINSNNEFMVSGPNSQDLTLNANGKSKWCLIKCAKNPFKKTSFLLMGSLLWGIEFSSGLRIRKSTEKYPPETIEKYLVKQVRSVVEHPDQWPAGVEIYFRP